MFVKYHVIIGFLVSLLIFLLFPSIGWFYASIIFLASFLIDFDHYLYYAVKTNDWSVKRAYDWNINHMNFMLKLSLEKREQYRHMIMIFHGIECWILLTLLIFVHKIFLFALIGVFIHMLLDFIELYIRKIPLYTKTSQVHTYVKNKKKKKVL